MATSFKYRFGKSLGLILVLAYVLAAIIGVVGGGFGVQALITFPESVQPWMIWTGVIALSLLVLWFVPRGIDVLILAPLAFWGGANALGLTYLMSGLLVGIPVTIVLLLSMGRK